MSVTVEFYGVPRLRAGVEKTVLEFDAPSVSLAKLVGQLAEQFRDFADEFIVGESLHDSLSANKNGETFVDDPNTPFVDGDTLLVLSADAGG